MVLVAKNPPANAADKRDADLIPGVGTSPGGGHGNPLQCSSLENPKDRGDWPSVSYSPWGCKEVDMTEMTLHSIRLFFFILLWFPLLFKKKIF